MIEGKTIISLLPSSLKRFLAGEEIKIDNQVLNLNSQLLLKLFYKMIDDKICNLTPNKARAMIDRIINLSYSKKRININNVNTYKNLFKKYKRKII